MSKALTFYQLIVILSIDSILRLEVEGIILSVHSDKKDIVRFLEELNCVLRSKNFDINKNLMLIKSKKETGKEQYSTPYTLADLDYDTSDIVARLKELTIREYSETLFDRDDDKPPLLFVFGKDINEKQVYIKQKIKGDKNKRVLCLSFHYAERKMEFPYA